MDPLWEWVSLVFAQLDGLTIPSSHRQRKSTYSDLRFIKKAGENSLLIDFICMHRLTKVRSFIVLFPHTYTHTHVIHFDHIFLPITLLSPFRFLPSLLLSHHNSFVFSCPLYFSPRAHTWEHFSVRMTCFIYCDDIQFNQFSWKQYLTLIYALVKLKHIYIYVFLYADVYFRILYIPLIYTHTCIHIISHNFHHSFTVYHLNWFHNLACYEIFNFSSPQENVNQNHDEISSYSCPNDFQHETKHLQLI